ncbi:hypothetical protein [Streptomyces sp. NPDC008150]|uniref:hypothetical protein n=1 Tax=Streptomyces sp. NPDC008150 TaxID=3364816 RepID=UPI0036EAF53F
MSAPSLTVTLSGGSAADAQAVVKTLEPAFGAAQEQPGGDDGATVHTATFGGEPGTAEAPGAPSDSAGRLSTALTVTVQGTPGAVQKAHEALAQAFTAKDQGTASGDQEQERQLLLEP